MVWFLLLHLVGLVVDLVTVTRSPERDKDLEILLLRHQLRLLQRQSPQPPRLRRWEKLTLTVLTTRLARLTRGPRGRLDEFLFLFKPDTVLKWHRELVRRKWTFRRPRQWASSRAGRGPGANPAPGARESELGLQPHPRGAG